jgi:hypothetical protein
MTSSNDEPNLDQSDYNPLVKTIACGNVFCSIFENRRQRNGCETLYYTVKTTRGYRDADGAWVFTNSFYKSHLPQLIHVCQKALEFLEEAESEVPF